MRTGLFSQPEVISEINKKFVSTWITLAEANKLATSGNPVAQTLTSNWEGSVLMVFLTPDGKLLSKLDSYKDFDDHCLEQRSVTDMAGSLSDLQGAPRGRSHEDVFLAHISVLEAKH